MSWLRTKKRTLDFSTEKQSEQNQNNYNTKNMNIGTFTYQTALGSDSCNALVEVNINNDFVYGNRRTDQNGLDNGDKINDISNQKPTIIKVLSNDSAIAEDEEEDELEDNVFENSDNIRHKIQEKCDSVDAPFASRKRAETWAPSTRKKPLESLYENEIACTQSTLEEEEEELGQHSNELPRRSSDSQVALNNPQANVNGEVRKQRKSITWAQDLETVHEFEKIKNRKISLSAFFKKI